MYISFDIYLYLPFQLPLPSLPVTFTFPSSYLYLPFQLPLPSLPVTFTFPSSYLYLPFQLPLPSLSVTFTFPFSYLYLPFQLDMSKSNLKQKSTMCPICIRDYPKAHVKDFQFLTSYGLDCHLTNYHEGILRCCECMLVNVNIGL